MGLVTFTISALMGAGPGYSQEAIKVALPDATKCPDALDAIATCYTAKHSSGAYLLAALPKNWNGKLVVFAHGGPDVVPPTATRSQGDLTKYGYAVKLGDSHLAAQLHAYVLLTVEPKQAAAVTQASTPVPPDLTSWPIFS